FPHRYRHALPARSPARPGVTCRIRPLRGTDAVGAVLPRTQPAARPWLAAARPGRVCRILLPVLLPAAVLGRVPAGLPAVRPDPAGHMDRSAGRPAGVRGRRVRLAPHHAWIQPPVARTPPDASFRRTPGYLWRV